MNLARALDNLARPPQTAEHKTYIRQVPAPFTAGQAVGGDWSFERSARAGYNVSSWVNRCLSMIMENGSTIPFGLQGIGSDGKWSFDWNAPLSRVLADWNDDFSAQENISRELAYLCLGGNALAGILPEARFRRSMDQVRELVAESPAGVQPIPDDVGGIAAYRHDGQYGQVPNRGEPWDAADICHGRLIDPLNPFWGQSRLKAIARAIDTDGLAADAYRQRLEQGGAPIGLLTDTSVTDPGSRAKSQKDFDAAWRNARGPLVTRPDVSWVSLGMTMEELEWHKSRLWSMREIVIGFGFHPALFGEDATYANTDGAERQKWTGAILPLENILGSMFTRRLLSRQERMKWRIWYDVSAVEALQRNLAAAVEMLVKLVASGCPFDTAKDAVGLPIPDLPNGQGKVPLMDSRLVLLKDLLEAEGVEAEVVGTAVEETLSEPAEETTEKARLILAGKWGRP